MSKPPPPAPVAPLPILRTALAPDQILDRLDKASRRGKLAGFHATGQPDSPFWIEIFGKFFHRRLLVTLRPAPQAESASTTLSFENRLRPAVPIAFWIVTILSVWPGVVLTDSLLATYFSWYPREFWITCAWYLPLTILPVPWMWLSWWRQSATIADAEARASIAKVAAHLGATEVNTDPGLA